MSNSVLVEEWRITLQLSKRHLSLSLTFLFICNEKDTVPFNTYSECIFYFLHFCKKKYLLKNNIINENLEYKVGYY